MVSHQLFIGKWMVDFAQVDLTSINGHYTTTAMKQQNYTTTTYINFATL